MPIPHGMAQKRNQGESIPVNRFSIIRLPLTETYEAKLLRKSRTIFGSAESVPLAGCLAAGRARRAARSRDLRRAGTGRESSSHSCHGRSRLGRPWAGRLLEAEGRDGFR